LTFTRHWQAAERDESIRHDLQRKERFQVIFGNTGECFRDIFYALSVLTAVVLSLQTNIRKWTGTIKLDGAGLGVSPSQQGIQASLGYQDGNEGSPVKQGHEVVSTRDINEEKPRESISREYRSPAMKTPEQIVAPPSPQEAFQRRCSALQPASLDDVTEDDGAEAERLVDRAAAVPSMTDTQQVLPLAGVGSETIKSAEDTSVSQTRAGEPTEKEMEISCRHANLTADQGSSVLRMGGVKAALRRFEDTATQASSLPSATAISPRDHDEQDPHTDPNT